MSASFKRKAPPASMLRLIPSKFPPIGLFDTVATRADIDAVLDLSGWSNDRLVPGRLARIADVDLPTDQPNISVILAAFLHCTPGGGRFNGPDLGAWYAAAELRTAAAEVGHHLRREAYAQALPQVVRDFRSYSCRLEGAFVDILGQQPFYPEIYDPSDYAASQAFGEKLRADNEDGIMFSSLRRARGVNAVAYRPRKILAVTQADHFRITVTSAPRKIDVERLSGTSAQQL